MNTAEITQVRRDLWGMWRSSVVSALVQSGVADALSEEPQPVAALATATDNEVGAVFRLLRCAAAMGYAREASPGTGADPGHRRFASTPRGALLRADSPGSLRELALMYRSEWQHAAWRNLDLGVRAGSGVLQQVLGQGLYEYLGDRPHEAQNFARAMTALTASLKGPLVEAYDFDGAATVVDIGGGQGSFLAEVLHHHPELSGLLIDQPRVVEAARGYLTGQGVIDRCRVVAGDFLRELPRIDDGSVVMLKSVLHNWTDDEARRILSRIREAVPVGTRLLIMEPVVDEDDWNEDQVLLDLGMLILSSGIERTLNEHQRLLDDAEFTFSRHIPVLPLASIVEAVAR